MDEEQPTYKLPWIYIENAFPAELARKTFETCVEQTINLPQKKVFVFGKPGYEPRLSQLYSTQEGHSYKYAGLVQSARPTSDIPEMQSLTEEINKHMLARGLPSQIFDTQLVNHYRAGKADKVGAHRDKDGIDSVIASISLGREAKFIIYSSKRGEDRTKVAEILLKPNSLFLMLPGMQENYLHEIKPFTKKEIKDNPKLGGARINITLRKQLV